MRHKVETLTSLGEAIRTGCPVLLHVPESIVPSLSQAFKNETITPDPDRMTSAKHWLHQHRRGNHAEIQPKTWEDFEESIKILSFNRLLHQLNIAYDGKVISAQGAFMHVHENNTEILDDRWGNSGPYLMHDSAEMRVGMARLFNKEGHVHIGIPYLAKGSPGADMQWLDITPKNPGLAQKERPVREFTSAGHIAAHEHD